MLQDALRIAGDPLPCFGVCGISDFHIDPTMAADEPNMPTCRKFTLATKSWVSGTNIVTFVVALPGDTEVAVDSGDPADTAEVLDDLEEPDDTGMAVELMELVMDAAEVIFIFTPRRSWCVPDHLFGVCGCLSLRYPAMLLIVKLFCRM